MPSFTSGNMPGFTSAKESAESQVWFSGRDNQHGLASAKIQLLADATDTGNTGLTSTLRGGQVLAIEAGTDDEAYTYDPDGVGGLDCAAGILEHAQDMLVDNTSTTRFTSMLVHGFFKEEQLVCDNTLGGLDEQAKAQLIRAGRAVFDGAEPPGAAFLVHAKRRVYTTDATCTVTKAENGTHFIAGGAANFTLPSLATPRDAVGLSYEFTQTANANLVITGSSNIVAKHNVSASTLTFSTANNKIGARVRVRAEYVSTTLKWIVEELSTCTLTVG